MNGIAESFVGSFGGSFLVQFVAQIRRAYPIALDRCDELDENMVRNVSGVHRWGLIESLLYRLANAHGIDAEWKSNATNSAKHVECTAGNFLLTVSKTDDPSSLPADAEFRTTLLENSQLRLFDEGVPDDGFVYAL
jgi:hypothetical protein